MTHEATASVAASTTLAPRVQRAPVDDDATATRAEGFAARAQWSEIQESLATLERGLQVVAFTLVRLRADLETSGERADVSAERSR